MDEQSLAAFFDEMDKIALAISSEKTESPMKPGEVKPPITPKQIQAKAVNPRTRRGVSTNYTRSNVEAPGTDVTISSGAKSVMPPPVRV